MSKFRIKIVGSGEYVAELDGGYVAGDGNRDFVWTDEAEARKAMEVCERHWGKMELSAA